MTVRFYRSPVLLTPETCPRIAYAGLTSNLSRIQMNWFMKALDSRWFLFGQMDLIKLWKKYVTPQPDLNFLLAFEIMCLSRVQYCFLPSTKQVNGLPNRSIFFYSVIYHAFAVSVKAVPV